MTRTTGVRALAILVLLGTTRAAARGDDLDPRYRSLATPQGPAALAPYGAIRGPAPADGYGRSQVSSHMNVGAGEPSGQAGAGVPGLPPLPGAGEAPPMGGATPGAAPAAPTDLATALGPGPAAEAGAGLGGFLGGGGGGLNMIGDQGPFFVRVRQIGGQPVPPDPRTRSLLAPSVRGFKIADNQSPIPQDRIFFSFNYFEDVNKRLNEFFEAPIQNLRIYRYVFGLEKTFDDGRGSFGLRLPLNTLKADSRERNLGEGGTSTALGDLTVFGKYVVQRDPRTGSLWTVGLAITPPTGPDRFAGAPFIGDIHSTTIQPFLAYYLNFGRLYLQGFSALDVPTTPLDATMVYNDVGLGYILYNADDPYRFLTAVVPTFEVHSNNPLTHRGEYDLFDRAGTPDILNLTGGIHFQFRRRALLTFGWVTPVTGPRPFDFEAVALLNIFFGGGPARGGTFLPPSPSGFPIIGG
jgi:hypothetical protein